MSIVIFEHSCPRCLTGVLKYKSNSKAVFMFKGVRQYNVFICDSCDYGDQVETVGPYRYDEMHRLMD